MTSRRHILLIAQACRAAASRVSAMPRRLALARLQAWAPSRALMGEAVPAQRLRSPAILDGDSINITVRSGVVACSFSRRDCGVCIKQRVPAREVSLPIYRSSPCALQYR